jgi:hypothetical protein
MKALFARVCLSVLLAASLAAEQSYEEKLLQSFEAATVPPGWEASAGISVVAEHATEGTRALKVVLEKEGANVGATGLKWNLAGYDKVKFDITNDGAPVVVTLQVKDRAGATYQSWYYLVKPGYNRVEYIIDGLASAVDITQVESINLRIDQETAQPATFCIDNIRATRGPDDDTWLLPKERPGTPLVVAGNLVQNPSFEQGMEQWGSWGAWDGGAYIFGSGSGPDAHTGGASAAIICQKPGRGGIYTDPIRLPAAGTYQVSLFVKGKDGARFRTSAANGQVVGAREFDVPGTWTEVTYQVKADDPAKEFRLYVYNVGTGTLFVDDVALLPPAGAPRQTEKRAQVARKAPAISIEGEVMKVDGKPFFPIGIYGVSDPKAQLAGTAFNLVTGGATSSTGVSYLDACAEAGVYSWVSLTGLMRAHLPWQAPDIVSPVVDHPAVIGWYLCDEPDHGGWNVPPPELRLGKKLIAGSDKGAHPAITLVMSWAASNIYQYRDTCDILASDPYCIKRERPGDLQYVSRCVDTMRAAVQEKKPVWVVLQAGWDTEPEPTREEEFAMTYLAVTHGADGILWFAFDYTMKRPALWQTLKDLAKELGALSPVLTGRTVWMKQGLGHPALHAILKETDKAYVLIAVNAPEQNAPQEDLRSVALPVAEVAGKADAKAKVWFENREVPIQQGAIIDNFRLYERHVYEIPK